MHFAEQAMEMQTKASHKWAGCRKRQDSFLMCRSPPRENTGQSRSRSRGAMAAVSRGAAGSPGPVRPAPLGLLQQRCCPVQLQCCASTAIQFPVYALALPYSTALKRGSVPAQLGSRARISVSCCSPQRRRTCLFDAAPTRNPSSLAVLWLRAESGPIHGQILPLSSLHTLIF